jgi:hypothetical protein
VDLLNQARWLSCIEPRDHIYSLLGHPLARWDGGSGRGIILEPDYNKDTITISAYTCAEDNIAQRRLDFAAYFRLWLAGVFGPNSSESKTLLPTSTLAHLKEEGEGMRKSEGEGFKERDEGGDDSDGDAENSLWTSS